MNGQKELPSPINPFERIRNKISSITELVYFLKEWKDKNIIEFKFLDYEEENKKIIEYLIDQSHEDIELVLRFLSLAERQHNS